VQVLYCFSGKFSIPIVSTVQGYTQAEYKATGQDFLSCKMQKIIQGPKVQMNSCKESVILGILGGSISLSGYSGLPYSLLL